MGFKRSMVELLTVLRILKYCSDALWIFIRQCCSPWFRICRKPVGRRVRNLPPYRWTVLSQLRSPRVLSPFPLKRYHVAFTLCEHRHFPSRSKLDSCKFVSLWPFRASPTTAGRTWNFLSYNRTKLEMQNDDWRRIRITTRKRCTCPKTLKRN